MSVNIYDIAKKAGVSVVTVSRVINNYPSVRPHNRAKVLEAMKELDYKPNAAARSLAKGRTGMVGLVLPSMQDFFMSQVVLTVENTLKAVGMFLVITMAMDNDNFMESSGVRLFREERVDGILLMSPVKNIEYVLELKRREFPFVLLDQYQSDLQVPSVTVDNFYGGYHATQLLIKGGARRIAHITGEMIYESSVERLNGFRKALEDNGLSVDENLIAEGDFTYTCGYKITKQWILEGKLPDAIFAADDGTAFGVLDAAREFNLSVPEQLAVIGYDDHPFTSMFQSRVSTVRQPAEEMGRCGVELLLAMIKGRVKRNTKVTLKPEIIPRGTTK